MKRLKAKKMVIFTTLFESKMGGIKDLLVILGKEKEVRKIDREYQRRKLLGPWGLKELAKLYRGISEDELQKVALEYWQKKLLKGLEEAIKILKERGFVVGALSSNPQFMLDILKERLPLDFVIGTELEFKEGVATGRIQREVNRYTKAKILKMKRKEYKVKPENVITIGRAAVFHLPIARESGIFIGFDPQKETIEDITRMVVVNKKLRKILEE